MAKSKAGVKAGAAKTKPASKPAAKKSATTRLGLLKTASTKMAKAAASVMKAAGLGKPDKSAARVAVVAPAKAAKAAGGKAAPSAVKETPPAKGKAKLEEVKETGRGKGGKGATEAPAREEEARAKGKEAGFKGPPPEKARPRATKLPPVATALNKREMEQLLTAGAGRGVAGEGSLKGRLTVQDYFPYLQVVGRDKRELMFLLQGPDQEVLPAYAGHKVSVSGLIRKTTNYGGTVDVRRYAAKKPEAEVAVEAPVEQKLKFLSPGEIEQVSSAGMGAGMRGFVSMRGNLEMTGEDFFLVVSNGGTRQQVSFVLQGKGAKGLRKHVGHTLHVNGVVEKSSGWGGTFQVESFEPRLNEFRAVSRESMEVVAIRGTSEADTLEMKVGQGLSVRLEERPGYTWAVEPTTAKRVGLREANFEPAGHGQETATREFFFTPRSPGQSDVDFFLAKAFNPAQVTKTFKLSLMVKP